MEISLTDFVEFTIKSGPAKVTKVREIKGRDPYEPAVDFWRPMRDGLIQIHRGGAVTKKSLDAIISAQSHALKLRLYPEAASGYLRFLGKRPPVWFEPPRGQWSSGALAVRVNPEVGLMMDGSPVVIKLYFKDEELAKPRVQASIGVMEAALAGAAVRGTQFGVLDIRRGKLLLEDGRWKAGDTQILIRGEARAFAEIWDAV